MPPASSIRSASIAHPTPTVRHALVATALSLGIAVGLVSAAGEPAQAQGEPGPWPQWTRDADHTRKADVAGPDDPGLAWWTDVEALTPPDDSTHPSDEPYESLQRWPSLSPTGDVLVRAVHPDDDDTSGEGRLLALDRDTGDLLWELADVREVCGQAADSQGRVWVQRTDEDPPWPIEAVDAASGEPITGTRIDDTVGCSGEPNHLQTGGDPEHLVVVGGATGRGAVDGVGAYDISGDTPEEAWRLTAADPDVEGMLAGGGSADRHHQVLVADEAVYAPVEVADPDDPDGPTRPRLVAIDLATGEITEQVAIPVDLAEADHDEPRADDVKVVNFVRAGDVLVVGVEAARNSDARGLLAGIDLATGLDEIAWQTPTGVDDEFTVGPRGLTLGDGVVALRDAAAGAEPLRAYAPGNGARQWTGVAERGYPATGVGARLADHDGNFYVHAPGEAVGVDRGALARLSATGDGRWYVPDAALEQEMGLEADELWRGLAVATLDDDLLVVSEDPEASAHDAGRIIALDDSGGLAEPWPGGEPGEAEPGEPGVARVDGVGSGRPRDIAIELCQLQHDDGAVDRLALTRDDEFADALAGSALPGVGCILFTPGGPDQPLHPDVRAEIDRVTGGLADLYLLGGDQAVSSQVEQELDQAGYGIARLEGTTRFETAEAIAQAAARAVATPREEVIVANGLDWVDAITSGAYAAREVAPVVLTPQDQLHPAAERVLDGLDPDRTWVVGGTAVVSSQAASATPNPERVAGTNRMGTAVAVADQMWPGVDGFAGDTYVTANLQRGDGWVPALAATRLSAAWNAPQLGVWTEAYPGETRDYLQRQGFAELPSVTLLGDVGFVSDDTAQAIHDDIQPE